MKSQGKGKPTAPVLLVWSRRDLVESMKKLLSNAPELMRCFSGTEPLWMLPEEEVKEQTGSVPRQRCCSFVVPWGHKEKMASRSFPNPEFFWK